MKLQTILILLASVVSVYSQAQDAPATAQTPAQTVPSPSKLEKCQKLIGEASKRGGKSTPEEQAVIQKCMDCYGLSGCLVVYEGGHKALSQKLGENAATRCEEMNCTTVVFDAPKTANPVPRSTLKKRRAPIYS